MDVPEEEIKKFLDNLTIKEVEYILSNPILRALFEQELEERKQYRRQKHNETE